MRGPAKKRSRPHCDTAERSRGSGLSRLPNGATLLKMRPYDAWLQLGVAESRCSVGPRRVKYYYLLQKLQDPSWKLHEVETVQGFAAARSGLARQYIALVTAILW